MLINRLWKCKKGKRLTISANRSTRRILVESKISHASGTNQIPRFVEFHPLTIWEKDKLFLCPSGKNNIILVFLKRAKLRNRKYNTQGPCAGVVELIAWGILPSFARIKRPKTQRSIRSHGKIGDCEQSAIFAEHGIIPHISRWLSQEKFFDYIIEWSSFL